MAGGQNYFEDGLWVQAKPEPCNMALTIGLPNPNVKMGRIGTNKFGFDAYFLRSAPEVSSFDYFKKKDQRYV